MLQVHTPTVTKHFIEELEIEFDPKEFRKVVQDFSYFKPQNKD